MPYISEFDRPYAEKDPLDAGELNFAITRLIVKYLQNPDQPMSYQRLNDCLGALEGAKLEFYRRVVIPYENGKKATNGDVY